MNVNGKWAKVFCECCDTRTFNLNEDGLCRACAEDRRAEFLAEWAEWDRQCRRETEMLEMEVAA